MGREELYFAKQIFKLRIHQYTGQQFEDFFIEIMSKNNNDFDAVKAHGYIGDHKNDGFDKNTGTFYQVYAPEEISKKRTISDGVRKMEEDFTELYKYWNDICTIRNFYFVINDKYAGNPEPIITKCLKLDKKYRHVKISIFNCKDLENEFNKLSLSQMEDIVGYIPSPKIEIIEYNALNEVIQFLVNMEIDISSTDILNVPDFEEKIKFNGLSDKVRSLLISGGFQEGELKKFFNENRSVDQELQKRFHALYELSKKEFYQKDKNLGDQIFFHILEKSCNQKTQPIYNSLLILMAHYFDSCDIFEKPEIREGITI